mgnify:CR=1 FL=1
MKSCCLIFWRQRHWHFLRITQLWRPSIFFTDRGIRIPDQISITGFDDNFYAQIVRPKLTTIHQDVHQKAVLALRKLLLMAEGKEPAEKNVKSPVWLVKRDSVKE